MKTWQEYEEANIKYLIEQEIRVKKGHENDPCLDCKGNTIQIGDSILAPFKSGGAGNGAQIVEGIVKKIGEPYHTGYGYYQRKITLQTKDGKTMIHPVPENCIKL